MLAVPEHHTGLTHDDPRKGFLSAARDLGFDGKVAVAAHHDMAAAALKAAQADLVLMPYRDAAYAAARMITEDTQPSESDMTDPDGQKELPT